MLRICSRTAIAKKQNLVAGFQGCSYRFDNINKFAKIFINKNISFSKGIIPENTTQDFMIVQDADRLDAIGAIGIARAFNYGGFRNNKIYNPAVVNSDENTGDVQESGTSSTISHFYEKLLLLKYRMNTLTAKKLAVERHEFLELFLKQFYKEWEFSTGDRL